MKTILFLVFLTVSTNTVKAETVWLLLHLCPGNASSTLEKIEMSGLDQCKEEASRLAASSTLFPERVRLKNYGFECIIGK